MKCWKCKEEMYCTDDTGWQKRKDGEIHRKADFICPMCRVYLVFAASDYSECDLEDE